MRSACRETGIVKAVLEGFNATVFAYGPTGAGKTFTMTGTAQNAGVIPQALADLFEQVSALVADGELDVAVTVSYIEIYNECIRDLLVPESPDLDLREDCHGNSQVCGVRRLPIHSADGVAALLREGNARRTQESTRANQASSRSHAILEVQVQRSARTAGKSKSVHHGRLYMIDLAGSERAASTGNNGQRMVEGQHINRSLLALGNCINALSKGSRSVYVNYRDSKLTRILKEPLAGNCRSVMIACISSASSHFAESYNTLNYAKRAMAVTTTAFKNTKVVKAHIAEFGHIIDQLRAEVACLRAKAAQQTGSGRISTTAQPQSHPASAHFAKLEQLCAEHLEVISKLCDLRTGHACIDGAGPASVDTTCYSTRVSELATQAQEKQADLARLVAAVEASTLPSSGLRNFRCTVDLHQLRVASLEKDTELASLQARLSKSSRDMDIRDRIIARQRKLLDALQQETPADLSTMYSDLEALRSRESAAAFQIIHDAVNGSDTSVVHTDCEKKGLTRSSTFVKSAITRSDHNDTASCVVSGVTSKGKMGMSETDLIEAIPAAQSLASEFRRGSGNPRDGICSPPRFMHKDNAGQTNLIPDELPDGESLERFALESEDGAEMNDFGRTYSKADSDLLRASVEPSDCRILDSENIKHAPTAPDTLPGLIVKNADSFGVVVKALSQKTSKGLPSISCNRTGVNSKKMLHQGRRQPPKKLVTVSSPARRAKRANAVPHPTSTLFSLSVQSSPYAAQPRKGRGLRRVCP